MKHIDFTFEGVTYALSFTAEALFTIYDKYGITDDLLETTACMEPTAEGFKSLCWIAALMATQGELQRRYAGEDPQPMLALEALRTGLTPPDCLRLRQAVRDAFAQGFERTVEDPGAEKEINLVLAEREAAEKKAKALVLSGLHSLLQQLSGSTRGRKKP